MLKTSRSKAAAVTPERLPTAIALRDLAVAPENLRYAEGPDDGIPELAETIFAAGLLLPLTVRPGRGDESPFVALDGRRRLLALRALRDSGRLDADHPVSCFVETDLARQAAAVVLTNTAVPVHLADVIVAIGRMLQARLTVSAIACALGYGELEVRRLAALSSLHPKAIEALRAGRCTLRQAKLLARLPDQTVQGEIAEAALNGFGFQEWKVSERLDQGQVTTYDRRYAFVGAARYVQGGGRLESDLFGERAAVILDPDRLQAAWTARAETFAATLSEAWGCRVVVGVDGADIDDAALEPIGDPFVELGEDAAAAWRSARGALRAARDALSGVDLASAEADPLIAEALRARFTALATSEPARAATLVAIFADTETGLDLRTWAPPALADEGLDPEEGDEDGEVRPAQPRLYAVASAERPAPTPLATAPAVELEGVNHRLHELRTDVATRALVRALADNPAAALVAVTARLFTLLVLRRDVGRGGGALSLTAEPYSRDRTAPIESLDGDVRRRLAERRELWAASGVSTIAWVAGLAQETQLTLLAELAGLCLDLREERTTSLRRAARAEAVEIGALCHADVAQHWTPDAPFLSAHSKAKLLGMLSDMGASEPLAAGAQKDELVALVAGRAAERRWAPAYLSWSGEPPADQVEEEPPMETTDDGDDAPESEDEADEA